MNHSPAELPHLLLVEDDPVNAAFLAAAAAALPAVLMEASCLADAENLCRSRTFDLLLFDANLPDGRGEDLLRTLREHGIQTIALAHTADLDPAMHARLEAAGFAEVLRKPMDMRELHAALRRHLPAHLLPRWDDVAALAALGGQRAHVQALRGMFLAELPGVQMRITEAAQAGDEVPVRAELHRLAASCGFVGAARLGAAVRGLQATPLAGEALQALQEAIGELLAPGP